MYEQKWTEILNTHIDNIYNQLQPHIANVGANRQAGVEVLLYVDDDGNVQSHTRSIGASDWREADYLLPIGSAEELAGMSRQRLVDYIFSQNALGGL